MHRRLMDYTNGHNLLSENQGGFRPGHSTIETVNELVDDIALNINNLEDTLVTFIDFKKAFDTVDHQILINKLDRIGIKGKNLLWLKSYLANRSQATIANNIISDRRQITCGVPQGSILGPYMFLIYINDLSNSLKLSSVKFYVDDTALYLKGTKPELLRHQMEMELRTMSDWCATNKLTINPKKTKAMYSPAKRKAKDFKPPLRICLKAEARTPVRTLHKLANLPELRTRRTAHIRTYAYKR